MHRSRTAGVVSLCKARTSNRSRAYCYAVFFCTVLKLHGLLRQRTAPPDQRPEQHILSIDLHISPVRDLKDTLSRYKEFSRVKVVDKSLSGACYMEDTCATDLRILNKSNSLTFGNCPNTLKRAFWDTYKNDRFMQIIDAFVCYHAFPLCEAFMSFAQPIIAIASTRYEIGRLDAHKWTTLNMNLRAMAAREGNFIAANNAYDAEYIKHFTCIKNVSILPNICEYVGATYRPRRPEFLIGPSRLSVGGEHIIRGDGGLLDYLRSNSVHHVKFAKVRDMYEHFTYADIAAHRGILLIPYQVSIMSLSEYYAMHIPLFVPSISLLIKWQQDHLIMNELSWNCVFGECTLPSHIPPCVDSPHPHDPNDITNASSLQYWLRFADFYQWPGIVYFSDWSDLIAKVETTDFFSVSKMMKSHWLQQKSKVHKTWKTLLDNASRRRTMSSSKEKTGTATWEDAVSSFYPTLSRDALSRC